LVDVELLRDGARDFVYLARWLDGVDVLDTSDPSDIGLLKNIPSATGSFEVSISGSGRFRGTSLNLGSGTWFR
jgi:hypothetical protein